MKHMLMDPAFPDIVGEWAARGLQPDTQGCDHTNDNDDEAANDLSDPLLTLIGKLEIAATRLW